VHLFSYKKKVENGRSSKEKGGTPNGNSIRQAAKPQGDLMEKSAFERFQSL
jgi:hypothetical protein